MAEYGLIYKKFWTNPRIRQLSEDARNLFIYLFSSPHSNTIGLYVVTKLYIVSDPQWLPERLGEPFRELLGKGFIKYDESASVILIVSWFEHNGHSWNPNRLKKAEAQLSELPKTILFKDFGEILQGLPECLPKRLLKRLPKAFGESLPQGLPEGLPYTESEAEAETEAVGADKPTKFLEGFKCLKIEESFYEGLKEAYPDIDLDLELKKADLWMVANPQKRKKDHKRFIRNWISRTKPERPAPSIDDIPIMTREELDNLR